jgi:mono/diheme cytochrome c family protein
MRVSRGALAAMVLAGLLGVAAGCGGDDDDSADETTTEAPATTTAPATTEAPATTTAPATTAAPAGGDVAAGMTFFAATCTSCHLENGTAAGGTGPQLSGAGLTEAEIREQVMNGGGAMPPGLATGQDLDNVTAYVLSLQ